LVPGAGAAERFPDEARTGAPAMWVWGWGLGAAGRSPAQLCLSSSAKSFWVRVPWFASHSATVRLWRSSRWSCSGRSRSRSSILG